MSAPSSNKTLLVTRPGTDEVMLVVAIVLDPETLDLERLLSALVPEMARGGVPGGLLVVGDSTLVLRLHEKHVAVDEVDTSNLLALADIEEHWDHETIADLLQQWIHELSRSWRDRVVGPLRDLLVPHIVAGLAGEVEIVDGLWGTAAHRLVPAEED